MAINDVTLTSGMRANLVSLQNTVKLINQTQQRLSSGLKVNSALDNPVNYFAAQALNGRAADLAGYKDGMSNSIQTIQAANQGISNISALISSAKALAASAAGLNTAGASGSQYDTANITVNNVAMSDTITIDVGGTSTIFTAVTGDVTAGSDTFSIGTSHGVMYSNAQVAANLAAAISSDATIGLGIAYEVKSVKGNVLNLGAVASDTSVGQPGINGSHDITSDLIQASSSMAANIVKGTGTATSTYSREQITVNNVAMSDTITIDVGGTNTIFTAVTGDVTSGSDTFSIGTSHGVMYSNAQVAANLAAAISTDATIGLGIAYQVESINGNSIILSAVASDTSVGQPGILGTHNITSDLVAAAGSMSLTNLAAGSQSSDQLTSLVSQYKTILEQIDAMAADSSFSGANLLTNASASAMVVNFGNGHSLSVQGMDATSTGLGLTAAQNGWSTSDAITSDTAKLSNALVSLQTGSSQMSNNLSVIQTRQDFSTALGSVLTTGADNLTLADMNQEGASMLMLQTRQSLGTTALSLSSQAAQSVLRLFA